MVFGASGSIGAAVAKEFAVEGARVFLAGQTKARLEVVANHIIAAGGEALTTVVDALNDADVYRYLEGVAKQAGKVDIAGSPARPHVPGVTPIGAAFGAIENLTGDLAFEVSPFGVRVVCLRTPANIDSRPIQDTMDFIAGRMNITKEQAIGQIALSNFQKVPATVQDTANAAVLIASDRARMMTATVLNATAGAALD